jgi:hypothetical protein
MVVPDDVLNARLSSDASHITATLHTQTQNKASCVLTVKLKSVLKLENYAADESVDVHILVYVARAFINKVQIFCAKIGQKI